jgi:membrane protease YdiL (CAAX protease family)
LIRDGRFADILEGMRSHVLTGAGLTLLLGAPLALLLTGNTDLAVSADAEAGTIPLALVVVPLVAGMLLIRLVPPRLPALPAVDAQQRPMLIRQVIGLIVIAALFPAAALLTRALPDGDLLYGPLKLLLLLGAAALVLRIFRAPSPAREHRRLLPAGWHWLGPIPAILAWGYLSFYSPLAGQRDMSGYEAWDQTELAVIALFTFVTASVTEEIFYRVLLQSRVEALYGRWPAITATALLFTVMHVHRFGDGPPWLIALLLLVSNGGFALFTGYLWARYRNVWSLFVVHGAVNGLALLPVLLG